VSGVGCREQGAGFRTQDSGLNRLTNLATGRPCNFRLRDGTTNTVFPNNRHKISRGAEGRTGARRQNPAGETLLLAHPWGSAKEREHIGYAFLSIRETNLSGSIHSKIPVNSGGISAYFGKRSGPTLGSWHQGSTLAAYFRGTTLAAAEVSSFIASQRRMAANRARIAPKLNAASGPAACQSKPIRRLAGRVLSPMEKW
jgi:hypothetical protein